MDRLFYFYCPFYTKLITNYLTTFKINSLYMKIFYLLYFTFNILYPTFHIVEYIPIFESSPGNSENRKFGTSKYREIRDQNLTSVRKYTLIQRTFYAPDKKGVE